MDTHIDVQYVGNLPSDWSPGHGPDAPQPTTALTSPPAPPSTARRTRYIGYIQAEINKRRGSTPAERSERLKWLHAVLYCVRDEHAVTDALRYVDDENDPDVAYEPILCFHILKIQEVTKAWEIATSSLGPPRDAADRAAQKLVPGFYGSRCVLTGTVKPQAAHILPVRSKGVDQSEIWRILRMFWPLPSVQTLQAHGHERRNIIPLTHTAHALWDWFFFALRPIAHETDPLHRLYIQVVWLRDPDGHLVQNEWNYARFGGPSDCRRSDGLFLQPAVRHGDIYELATDDPIAFPLPSEDFLRIQYYIHKIKAGMMAAGALNSIFSEDPPPPDAGADENVEGGREHQHQHDHTLLDGDEVLGEWALFLEAAQEQRILDNESAARWARAFAIHIRKEEEEKAAYEAASLASYRRLTGEEDEEGEDDEELQSEDGSEAGGDDFEGR